MQVEIWSDIVCPWCYIGKRRFEKALASFAHADQVEVTWRSFQLDPGFAKGAGIPVYDALSTKMGAPREQVRAMTEQVKQVAAEEGLEYDFASGVMVNTFDAHRLVHLAQSRGLGDAAHERFMDAQLVRAKDLSDPETLVAIAVEIGLEEAEAREVLAGDAFTAEVNADIDTARQLGATGVPFFVMDRAFGVSGAQPVEVFLNALEKAHQAAQA
ncbi:MULTISPECIES: DsbA family oxidoreductase [unclassified Nocardiopsis]|uniref:DsbA family oxidoreductase n=2 Tax=Nocardiopsidaceae TaxID=83676 RepID=UPI00387AF798